jgi:type IX secretion system PorP/SprF family membrane protein
MKKNLRTLLLIFGSSVIFNAYCQDVHFSFAEYSNMNLNPALAGANSPMQGVINYRNQWSSVGEPFQTIAASFDGRFNDNKRNKSGIFAGGISFYNDQAGDIRVSTSSVNLNLAYHLLINDNNTIGLGIYGGFGQRSLNAASGKWATQYNNGSYDASINSGEVFSNTNFGFVDAGAGLLYTYNSGGGYMRQNKNTRINAGLAFYHVNQPYFSFISTNTEKLYMRISGFANAEIGIANTSGSILPGVYYHRQGNAQEILLGANYKILMSEGSKVTGFNRPMAFYVGAFGRLKDAFIAKFMFEFDQFMTGVSYDVNMSSLNDVSRARGGVELFLRFNAGSGYGSKSRI